MTLTADRPTTRERRSVDRVSAIDTPGGRESLSLADAIADGVAEARAGRPIREVAPALAASLGPEAMVSAAARGLATMIHDALGNHQVEAADGDAESETSLGRLHPRSHPAADVWRWVLGTNYEGADGIRRPLIDFTLADVEHRLRDAAGKAAAYLRQQAAMELAVVLLGRHHKSRIGDLPEKAQREIAEALA